jgi:hypothetical protein
MPFSSVPGVQERPHNAASLSRAEQIAKTGRCRNIPTSPKTPKGTLQGPVIVTPQLHTTPQSRLKIAAGSSYRSVSFGLPAARMEVWKMGAKPR